MTPNNKDLGAKRVRLPSVAHRRVEKFEGVNTPNNAVKQDLVGARIAKLRMRLAERVRGRDQQRGPSPLDLMRPVGK